MNGKADTDTIWNMLLDGNAAVFGLDEYGLEEGTDGSLVVFDARTPFDALRTQPVRPLVLRDGEPIARSERSAVVYPEGGGTDVDFDM